MVPMMVSLLDACIVILICAGAIVALGMAVRWLEPADRRSPIGDARAGAGTVAERRADREPKRAGTAASEAPVPAQLGRDRYQPLQGGGRPTASRPHVWNRRGEVAIAVEALNRMI